MKTPFLGGMSVYRSINMADNRCVNIYPEVVETKDGKDVGALIGCPGTTRRLTLATTPVRGLFATPTILYAVAGNKFYSIDTAWSATERGTLSTSSGQVSMDWNGTQVMIVDGTYGYTYTVSGATFAQITDPDFPGADTVRFLDTYFIINWPSTGKFMISSANDGTAWDALDFATAEGSPDNVVAVETNHRQLYLFGTNSTEVWINTGAADFPFERIGNTFIEQGCVARGSIAKMDNSVYWVGKNSQGNGVVWKLTGYTPTRVSTHSIENRISTATDMSDIVGYAYQQEGHTFYVISSTTGNWTMAYDVASGLWHERAFRNTTSGVFERHKADCYAFFNGYHVIGDYVTGEVYTFHLDVYADDGDPLRWLRTWRALAPGENDLNSITFYRLQIDLEAGVGLSSGQGSDPQVTMRYSNDGGHTFGNDHSASIGGATGEFGWRAIWRRLSSNRHGRDRVFELSGSDPVKRVFIGARMKATASNS